MVVTGMARLAAIADEALEALRSQQHVKLCDLMEVRCPLARTPRPTLALP